MKVAATNRPVIIDSPSGVINSSERKRVKSKSNIRNNFDGEFSYFDESGKPTNSAETKLFHDWLDRNKPGWHPIVKTIKKDVKKGYGVYPFSPATDEAWAKYGTEFVNFGRGMAQNVLQATQGTTTTDPQGNVKPGMRWDKLKGIWVKAQDSGLLSALGQFLGKSAQGEPQSWTGETPPPPPEAPEPEKMKTGTIALIGIGVVALIVGIYFMTKTDEKK